MATSSIFADFDITDRKKARSFVEAVEKSAKSFSAKPKRRHKKTLVTDRKQVKAIFQALSTEN